MEKSSKNLLENKWFLLLVSLLYFSAILAPGSIFWMTIPFYLAFIVTYVAKRKDYGNKPYITSIILLMALECLLLIYIYLFNSSVLENPVDLVWFLFLFILSLSCLFYYLRWLFTGEYKKIAF